MSNASLVAFTLLVQSATGLVWVAALTRWWGRAAGPPTNDYALALVLSFLALVAALGHLTRPFKAPQALRNLAASWLSREIVSVSTFTGVLVLLVFVGHDAPALEMGACLLGALALVAMIRVYLLAAVPVWNTLATPLEFVGSALLLGGGLRVALGSLAAGGLPGSDPIVLVALGGIILGLILKVAALSPALSARRKALAGSWYAPPWQRFSMGGILGLRLLLNLTGAGLIAVAMGLGVGPWLPGTGLALITAAEVLGRWWFYRSYLRVGL